jgi:hypothetical protein
VALHAFGPLRPPLTLGAKDGVKGGLGSPAADRGADLLGRSTGEAVTGGRRHEGRCAGPGWNWGTSWH